MNNRISMAALGVIVAAAALSACSKTDQESAKNSMDQGVAQVDQKARQVGNEAKDAATKVGDKVEDAVITATVKTEIAKDSELSALKINVDTTNGNVALQGTAPSTVAKERATSLATGVKGVANVDNQLSIAPEKK